MDKRYQVFVSSTFTDLQEERRKVINTVMELDYFPAGMELFPAADQEQWAFIRRVIDDCDYYLLVIGGRYGSLTDEGVSYTEKEYNYAVERGIPVLAFLHERPDEIPAGRSDLGSEARERLHAFRSKVSEGRLVRFWTSADALPGLVALSLPKAIKMFPAVGWIRATGMPTTETLAELNELRKQIAELDAQLLKAKKASALVVTDLAPLDAKIAIQGTFHQNRVERAWSTEISWKELFGTIAPTLLLPTNDAAVRYRMASLLVARTKRQGTGCNINAFDFDTIKVQLLAFGLIVVEPAEATRGGVALFWGLTPSGKRLMLETRSIRATDQADVPPPDA